MDQIAHLNMQHSESVVAIMAATIFAGPVRTQGLSTETEDALVEKSVAIAIKIALRAENNHRERSGVDKERGELFTDRRVKAPSFSREYLCLALYCSARATRDRRR